VCAIHSHLDIFPSLSPPHRHTHTHTHTPHTHICKPYSTIPPTLLSCSCPLSAIHVHKWHVVSRVEILISGGKWRWVVEVCVCVVFQGWIFANCTCVFVCVWFVCPRVCVCVCLCDVTGILDWLNSCVCVCVCVCVRRVTWSNECTFFLSRCSLFSPTAYVTP
jgi:hypothetical protein